MHHIIIQMIADKMRAPQPALLRKWIRQALAHPHIAKQVKEVEVTIRIIEIAEMTALNSQYRHKKGPTNVLSFPFVLPHGVSSKNTLLGDIVICADVVNQEAKEQNKTPASHWAHMLVHGLFHLLGYDHQNENEAEHMEALEIEVMRKLGFANPYEIGVGS